MLKAYGFKVKLNADISRIYTHEKNLNLEKTLARINKLLSYKIGYLIKKDPPIKPWEKEEGKREIDGDYEDEDEDSFIPKERWVPFGF